MGVNGCLSMCVSLATNLNPCQNEPPISPTMSRDPAPPVTLITISGYSQWKDEYPDLYTDITLIQSSHSSVIFKYIFSDN